MSMSAIPEQLFQALFPGQQYSADRATELAARLRAVAEELQPSGGGAQEGPRADQAQQAGAAAEAEEERDEGGAQEGPSSKKRRKDKYGRGGAGRDLDFSSYHSRYVALELLYLGGPYQGFAAQADTEETIEGHLFRAMRKTRLIRPDASWQDLQYSRGGRTDKGVSALGQVVALTLRSQGRVGQPLPGPDAEMDYPAVLNRALPADIRVTGWAPVPLDFSARFSASFREYKYFIVQRGGLDTERMAAAAANFVGEHDFRNFCKVDAAHVSTFRRTILDFRVTPVEGCAWEGRQLYELYIRGTAFLWHQVRCMAAVLFMVGRGEEEPDVVQALLDVQATPCKPQYVLAPEDPLLLYSCTYPDLRFRRPAGNQDSVQAALGEMLDRHLVAAGMLSTILGRLGGDETLAGAAGGPGSKKRGAGGGPAQGPRHVKLLQRAREPALEERFAKFGRQLEAPAPAGGLEAQRQAQRQQQQQQVDETGE